MDWKLNLFFKSLIIYNFSASILRIYVPTFLAQIQLKIFQNPSFYLMKVDNSYFLGKGTHKVPKNQEMS